MKRVAITHGPFFAFVLALAVAGAAALVFSGSGGIASAQPVERDLALAAPSPSPHDPKRDDPEIIGFPYHAPLPPTPTPVPMPPAPTPVITGPVIDVAVIDIDFRPRSVTVNVGDTVRWTQEGQLPHTTTSDTGVWGSDILSIGQSFSFTFTRPGTFPYHCAVHLNPGTVIVQAAAVGTATPTPPPVVRISEFTLASGASGGMGMTWRLTGSPARLEVVRFSERGLLPPLVLAPTATNATDSVAMGEVVRCFAVQAKDPTGRVVGQSELGCGVQAQTPGGPRTISITYAPGTTRAIIRWEAVAGATRYEVVPVIPLRPAITTSDTSATVETGGQLFCALVVVPPAAISNAICGLVAEFRIPAEVAASLDGGGRLADAGAGAAAIAARLEDLL